MDSFETARQHFQAGRFAQAEGVCRQILAGQPQHPLALCLLGQILLRRGSARSCGATHLAVDPVPADRMPMRTWILGDAQMAVAVALKRRFRPIGMPSTFGRISPKRMRIWGSRWACDDRLRSRSRRSVEPSHYDLTFRRRTMAWASCCVRAVGRRRRLRRIAGRFSCVPISRRHIPIWAWLWRSWA